MRIHRNLCITALALACAALIMTAGAQKRPSAEQPQTGPRAGQAASQQNKVVARRVFEELTNQGRYEAVDEIFDRNCKVHFGDRTLGLAQAEAEGKGWKSAAPDMFMNVEEITESGDKVTVVWSVRGTHTGQGLGVKPTRRQVSMHDKTVFLIKNGKIVEVWNSEYRRELFRQLGVSETRASLFFTTERVLAALDPIIPNRLYSVLFR